MTGSPLSPYSPTALEPDDPDAFRVLAHRMLDDMLDDLAHRRDRPLWQPIPEAARAPYREASPRGPTPLAALREQFLATILPYATGNTHPGFMGWVHGGGTALGMVAEMLAAGLNANLGGRDHVPVEVERQVIRWAAEWFGFPLDSSGLLVTGSSMANLIAVLCARHKALGPSERNVGVGGHRLTAYAGVSATPASRGRWRSQGWAAPRSAGSPSTPPSASTCARSPSSSPRIVRRARSPS
jgi:aromatic-L-amino-acid/L-tryptophan decarboxylase